MAQRAPMQIAFRTDASIEIGTGHVMRCLTLAAALRERGAECVFLCRRHPGHMLDHIAEQGHTALALPDRDGGAQANRPEDPAHAAWLGTGWAEDAQDSLSALAAEGNGHPVDWLIVDHYALDVRWEAALRPACPRLMVIDDLADRRHDCDLLLDQSLGREAGDYAGLLPAAATTLLGPDYALLRPEFARMRAESLARRAKPTLERVLVTMGGVDKDDATSRVLDALDGAGLPVDVTITVVMGQHAPWLAEVRARAQRMRNPTEVLTGVRDMARLMAESDLAIGAGGATTWERCSLGVPAVQVALAANQREINEAIGASNAAIPCDVSGITSAITDLLRDPFLSKRLAEMSRFAAQVTDGQGVERVCRLVPEGLE